MKMSDKDKLLEIIQSLSESYNYHLSETERLRNKMSEQIIQAHRKGASDMEISKYASLSRARVQQLRANNPKHN
jgi:ribosome maturation factor RimP